MKFHLAIFLLLTALVALPTGSARACGDAWVIQNTAVSAPANDEHCATSGDECVETHPGQDCPPDTDGCGNCHCPGCGATGGITHAGFFKNTFAESSAPDWSCDRRAAIFCYQASCTSAHLAALFRPPISHLV
ncbi:MAG TPA: hypothetical protein PK228_06585 [Saprospiraceae bacterium]|nr:hypothetical protein [Saprospiraceae bacterium]